MKRISLFLFAAFLLHPHCSGEVTVKSVDQHLLEAVMKNDVPAVKKALKEKANINVVLTEGDYAATPLSVAIEKQYFDLAKMLIQNGAAVNTADGTVSPLMAAIQSGNEGVVDVLLKKGANPNARGDSGTTPLILAVEGDNLKLAQLLVSRGADINAENKDDGSSLFYVASLEMMQFLVSKGGDIRKTRLADGATLLMDAVQKGNFDIAQYLVNQGIDVNAKTESGLTALSIARALESIDLIELLQQSGARE